MILWLIAAVFLGFLLTGICAYIFPKIGLRDYPERYPHEAGRDAVAYPGGLLFLLGLVLLPLYNPPFWVLLPPLVLLGIVHFFDDRHQIPWYFRLGVQSISVLFLLHHGISIEFIGHPFADTNLELLPYSALRYTITTMWILLIINAINWYDGLPGQLVSSSSLAFLSLGILGVLRPELLNDASHLPYTFSFLLIGAGLLGSAPWFIGKKILAGDTGSQVLGFSLAVLSIMGGAKIATTLIVLALPILDALLTIARRIYTKSSLWKGDTAHLHHMLQQQYGTKKALSMLLMLQVFFCIVALSTTLLFKFIGLILCSVLVLIIWTYTYQNR